MRISIGGFIKTIGTILVFAGANLFLLEMVWRMRTAFPPPLKPQFQSLPSRIADRPKQVSKKRTPHAIESVSRVPVVTKPTLLFRTEPQYTDEARAAKFSGKVRVSFVVDENGRARDITVLDSPGLGLDDNILRAIEQWRWRPATRDGVQIAMPATAEVNFRLL
jgi:TonB family protein